MSEEETELWAIPKWWNFVSWLRWMITGKPILIVKIEGKENKPK